VDCREPAPEITEVVIEVKEPNGGDAKVGEEVTLEGYYVYTGSPDYCTAAWSITGPDGNEISGVFYEIDVDFCITQIKFIPEITGVYEINYTVRMSSTNIDDPELTRQQSLSLTVIDPLASIPCTLDEDCGTDSQYVPNIGCVNGADALEEHNWLTNAGFELDEYGSFIPSVPNSWSGDNVSRVNKGDPTLINHQIEVLEGDHVLRFDYCSSDGPISGATGSEILQSVLLPDSIKTKLASTDEEVKLKLSGYFNRIQGNEETDNLFGLSLMAFAGAPDTFRDQFVNQTYLTHQQVSLQSDDCVNTWEYLNAEISLPDNTDFIGINVYAAENITDNGEGEVEFDGHYVDAISVYLVE